MRSLVTYQAAQSVMSPTHLMHGGCVQHGEPVEYRTVQQGLLLNGEVHIKPGQDAMTGILCHCCHSVVSCSKFEAHAGQGSRRWVPPHPLY